MRKSTISLCLTLCATPALSQAVDTNLPPALDRPIAYLAHTQDSWQVWTMQADGRRASQVTRSSYEKAHVSWYPDGRRVLVTSTEGRLFDVDVASGSEAEVHLPIKEIHDAEVSADGREIIFSANAADARDGNEIWGFRLADQTLRRITRIPWLQHEPSVSPDGAWIYFASGNGQQAHDIFRVTYDGSSVEQVTAGHLYNFGPTVSGRGALVFSSNRTGDYEIWLQEGAQAPRRLTDSPGVDGGASFAPEGRELVFHSSRTGRLQIFHLALDDREATELAAVQLTAHAGGARAPDWWALQEKESYR